MQIYTDGKSLTEALQTAKGRVGFVPTMGALHSGHLELVKMAQQQADVVVVSVFVNPTQFNNPEDLEKYPRDNDGDAAKLKAIGCDILWLPQVEELYPSEVISEDIDLGVLDTVMEGEYRPGHFQGVATVVDRLFKWVKPDVALFGEKDYQQVAVIRRMVEIKGHTVEILTHDTVREEDGLAMSSRNLRLSKDERALAPVIYQVMNEVRVSKRLRSPADAQQWAREVIDVAGLATEYVSIADSKTLKPIEKWEDSEVPRIFVAAYLGDVRLIDNFDLN